jgi:hypothetical protein
MIGMVYLEQLRNKYNVDDNLRNWKQFAELLINNHGKLYAVGFLIGWLYRLSRTDVAIRVELKRKLEAEQKLFNRRPPRL